MKKLFEILGIAAVVVMLSPFLFAWVPGAGEWTVGLPTAYWHSLVTSFRQLSITLAFTVLVAGAVTVVLGYCSILWPVVGKTTAAVLDAVESIPAILVALFCYAPVAVALASNSASTSTILSLSVFIFAATLTTLPEAVRGVALPLGELYHRKYSVSLRSYGFTRGRILAVLLNSKDMRDVLRRTAAVILLKTLVLDCSFSFIIQVGMGANGTPAHTSPGGLIAAWRMVLLRDIDGSRVMFWLPVILLVMVSFAFLLLLGQDKQKEQHA
jgi:hypothetical protein